MKKKEYKFVPAYHEWHFVDEEGNILLVWDDPVDDLFYATPTPSTVEEVWDICHDFYLSVHNAFEEGEQEYNGITAEEFSKLPPNCEDIMAQALYNYYIEP